MASSFASSAASTRTQPSPFRASIPDVELEDFRHLLRLSKIGPRTYENEQSDGRFGITRDWLVNAKAEWQTFDW